MRNTCGIMAAVAIATLATPVRAAPNLVTDPGFESCPAFADLPVIPPGWTVSSQQVACGPHAHTGSADADFSAIPATLSQIITTIAGDSYDFSFWIRLPAGSPSSFSASFGSDQVFSLTDQLVPNYTLESFTMTADASSTTIAFTGASLHGIWELDDVSVTDLGSSPVPEPTAFTGLLTGLVALASVRRR